MRRFLPGLLAFSLLARAQGVVDPPLTAETLRAWLVSGGVLESNRRLIHEQFTQQRKQLPPWWPGSVADEEEQAIADVDMVPVAVPFYQPCFTDREVRVIVKFAATAAGKRVTQSAVATHEQAEVNGSSAMAAQHAGENAADATSKGLSHKERADAAAALTPEEQRFAAVHFSSERMQAVKQCTNGAYAQTVAKMGELQTAAVKAVVEKHRPELRAAREAWEKDHSQPQ